MFARLFAAQVLADEGFVPLEAENSVEALDVLDRNQNVSVLVTDVCMADDTDGLVLAKKVSRKFPRIRIIVVSGQVRPAFVDIPPGATFLAKPYNAYALAALIRGES